MARTAEQIQEDDKNKIDLNDQTGSAGAENTGAAPAEKPGPTPEEVAGDLRKQLEEANAARLRAEAGKREADERAAGATTRQQASVQSEIATREAAIASRKTAAQAKLDSVKQQLKIATSSDDRDAMVDLQDEMTNARYELNAATWEENNFKTWKENQGKQQSAAQAQGDQSVYTKKEQAWIDSHPEFNTNKKFARLAKIAAQEAKDEGYAQDSKGYFTYIEQVLKDEGLLGDTAESRRKTSPNDDPNAASTATPPNQNYTGSVQVPSKNSKYPFIPKGFNIPKQWIDDAPLYGFEGPEGYLEYANDRLKDEAERKANPNGA